MRRTLIHFVLRPCFCLLPVLAAILVAAVIPYEAVNFFLGHIGPMDALILGLGIFLFTLQVGLCWRALEWKGNGFNESPDHWINHLAQAAEWFPMLGLLGTVGGILQTFSSIGPKAQPHEIINKYAPAITATGCGLYMAFINILPMWLLQTGRDLITTLGGAAPHSTTKAEDRAP